MSDGHEEKPENLNRDEIIAEDSTRISGKVKHFDKGEEKLMYEEF